ncbi:MAG: hypothetical protein EBT07_16730 [Actinobacteria bacterium]|nr:hypothetical protein [Actinomycetota bacterium]
MEEFSIHTPTLHHRCSELGGEDLDGRIAHARTQTASPLVQEDAHALLAALEGVRTTLIGGAATHEVDVRAADAISKSVELAVVAVVIQGDIHGNGVVASLHYEYLQFGLVIRRAVDAARVASLADLYSHSIAGSSVMSTPLGEFSIFVLIT